MSLPSLLRRLIVIDERENGNVNERHQPAKPPGGASERTVIGLSFRFSPIRPLARSPLGNKETKSVTRQSGQMRFQRQGSMLSPAPQVRPLLAPECLRYRFSLRPSSGS